MRCSGMFATEVDAYNVLFVELGTRSCLKHSGDTKTRANAAFVAPIESAVLTLVDANIFAFIDAKGSAANESTR